MEWIERQVMQVMEHNQFGSSKPVSASDPQHCAQCEAMLTDALDGTLSAADQATFDRHIVSCTTCSEMFADAQRGAAWLSLLKSPRPEPSANLLERIFAQTCGATSSQTSAAADQSAAAIHLVSNPNTLLGHPMATGSSKAAALASSTNVLPFRNRLAAGFNLRSIGHTLLQPRLAMTAAMAFFSIALTLNLTGVQLSALRASDLKPSNLKRNFYEANAHVVRYYDNLRVVYELESRVHDLQRSSDDETPASTSKTPHATPDNTGSKPSQQPSAAPSQQPSPNGKDDKQSRPKPSPGTSRRENPVGGSLQYVVGTLRNGEVTPIQSTFEALLPSVALTNNNQYSVTRRIQEGRLV